MTIGSPVASAVSGPGTAETKAIRRPSGDHVMRLPVEGNGLFVPSSSARNFGAKAGTGVTMSADLPLCLPAYASRVESGDQVGSEDESFPALSGVEVFVEMLCSQICE